MSVAENMSRYADVQLARPELPSIESALTSADFSLEETPPEDRPRAIGYLALNGESHPDRNLTPFDRIEGLQDHMGELLARPVESWYRRNQKAALLASTYRAELVQEAEDLNLTDDDSEAVVLARLYLSSIESFAELHKFKDVLKEFRKKSPEAQFAKTVYLAARKKFQEDIDDYIDMFDRGDSPEAYETLIECVTLARWTLNGQENDPLNERTYVFIASALSERAVMLGLQEHFHPEARYGTPEEDRSPTKADVVFPIPRGDMHVQVKMNWTGTSEFHVQPNKKIPRVTVPMQSIRSRLTELESQELAKLLPAVERKAMKLEIQEACAMKGLAKYAALSRVPTRRYSAWWSEFKQVVSEERQQLQEALQTGVNAVELGH